MPLDQRALIVDDHPIFRDALEAALKISMNDNLKADHASSIDEAITALTSHQYQLVLLDLNLSDTQGFDGLMKVHNAAPECPIVVVSATETSSAYKKAKSLGARGYLPKSLPLNELAEAFTKVLSGGDCFPELEWEGDADAQDKIALVASLTPAQRRVIEGLSNGLLNKQIAFEMSISEATVKAHMTTIFRKLGANNRTQALLIYNSAMEA